MALCKRCLFIAFAMTMTILLSFFSVQGEPNCNQVIPDLNKLYVPCQKAFVSYGAQVEPSEDCYKAFKEVDLPCCCKHIPKDFEENVSMEKFAYVAKKCGRALPSGSKCGSYTIPRA